MAPGRDGPAAGDAEPLDVRDLVRGVLLAGAHTSVHGDVHHPSPERYHHNRTGEDNCDAHHKRPGMGEVAVAVMEGKLDFGPWKQTFYGSSTGGVRSGCW